MKTRQNGITHASDSKFLSKCYVLNGFGFDCFNNEVKTLVFGPISLKIKIGLGFKGSLYILFKFQMSRMEVDT